MRASALNSPGQAREEQQQQQHARHIDIVSILYGKHRSSVNSKSVCARLCKPKNNPATWPRIDRSIATVPELSRHNRDIAA